jgi:serine/threonine protein kinase/tetratricopeptide (TPR) repeat protein
MRTLPHEPEDAFTGKLIGAYRIVREIGRGGMGAVYLAERADEEFRQRVALKVIKRGMDWDEIVRRFRRERQVLAALNHPNIARLLDGGTTDEGLPFFVMELVEGTPITEFCDECKLNLTERLHLFQKVCDAIAYIHKNLIIHRDIKPSNILVTAEGVPKVLDFGVAKLLMPTGFLSTIDQTATGVQPMTPRYASPEQLHGGKVTYATDVYSLGVLLYELLCGYHPLGIQNDHAPLQILKLVAERDPTAPSAAAVTKTHVPDLETSRTLTPETVAERRHESPYTLHKHLRGDLDNIALKALGKEPERRYQTVAEMSEDIRRHLEGLPITARPASMTYRTAKFVRRRRTGVAVAALILVLILSIGGSWSYFYWRSKAAATSPSVTQPHSLAVLPFTIAAVNTDDQTLASDLTETLISRLGRIQELEVRPASAVAAFADKDAIAAGKELKVETVLETTVERIGDQLTLKSRLRKTTDGQTIWTGTFDDSLAGISHSQDAIAERVAGTLLGQLTVEQRKKVQKRYTDNAEAYKLYLQGRYLEDQQTEEALRRSIQAHNHAIQLDPGYALAYCGLADAYAGLSAVYLAPHEAQPKAKAAAVRALELDPELPEAHVALASALENYEWNFAAAEAEYKRALELNPNYASAHHWYGRFLALNRRREESTAQFKRAAELDPLSPFVALDTNFIYFNWRDYDHAIEQINKAIELNDSFWFAYWVRGWAKQEKGDVLAAIDDYQKADSIGRSPATRAFLANAYAVSGRRDEARQILTELLELRKTQFVAPSFIASIYAGLGDREQTFAWLEKGYEEREDMMLWNKYDYRFGEFRKDPRFQDLLRRVGLPD